MASTGAKRAARVLQRETDARFTNIHQDWARRHPEAAGEERALRLQGIALRKQGVENAKDWIHKDPGTPETHDKASRTRQGALARLYVSGAISIDQLAWAAEIAQLHALITKDVGVRTASLETRISCSRSGNGFFEALGRVRAEVAYSTWRASLPEPWPVLAMIVDDCGVSAAAARFAMHKRRAKALLTSALDLWADSNRRARDEVDEATLLAAQAGLL